MTINNLELFIAGLWDWGFLDDCFTDTNIKVTDIDGMVERNGKFLMIETKSPGAAVPQGQEILFRNFVSLGNTVIVIWGRQDAPPFNYRIIARRGYDKTFTDKTVDDLKKVVKKWFEVANRD